MSIPITFYTFGKRKNSTKLVNVSGTQYSCNIKEPCSVLNPVIELNGGNKSPWNYCYIHAFERYYFITDWIADHGMWYAHCTCDVLASWRTQILASAQYVSRSGNKSNPYIIDSVYPMTNKVTYSTYSFPSRPFLQEGTDLRYVVGIASGNSVDKVGGLTYFNLSYGEMKYNLLPKLLGDASYLGTQAGITDTIMKAMVNPLSYIGESFCLGYNPGGDTVANLYAGWWMIDTTYSYHIFNNNDMLSRHLIESYTNVNLPLHPQTSSGSYLNCEPYRRLRLDAGPFGMIALDSTAIANCSSVDFNIYGDIKGNCELQICDHTSGDILSRYYADTSVPISLTQIGNSPSSIIGVATGAAELTAGAVTVNPAGVIDGAVNGIKSAEGYLFPQSTGSASVGSFDSLLEPWRVVAEFRHIVDTEPGLLGHPLCENWILSNCTGYTQIVDPDVDFACYDSEHDQIVSFMEGGFYIE